MIKAEVGVIGGSGISDLSLLSETKEINIDTPYGKPSDSIIVGKFQGRQIAFMARHGRKHSIPAHKVNYRANIWALKEIGIRRIIASFAVGSLSKEIKPGDIAILSQFIDFTKSRIGSFFEEGNVVHISVSEPFCPELQNSIINVLGTPGIKMHNDCTYVCVEGPRFSTRAESEFYKSIGANIIGMTLVPEYQLATEMQMCYGTIAIVTDSDAWSKKTLTAKETIKTFSKNAEKTKKLFTQIVEQIPNQRKCSCQKILEDGTIKLP